MTHGGYREGSGRKPILDGGIKRTFVLTPAHLAMIDAWGDDHALGNNRSASLRHLIEQSASPMVRAVVDAARGVLNTVEVSDHDVRGMPASAKVRYTRVVMLEEALARWSPTPTKSPDRDSK